MNSKHKPDSVFSAARMVLERKFESINENFNYKDGGEPNKISPKELKSIIEKFAVSNKLKLEKLNDWDLKHFVKSGEFSAYAKKADADTPSSPSVLLQFTWYGNSMQCNIHGYKDNLVKGKPLDKVTIADVNAAFDAEITGRKPIKGVVSEIKKAAVKVVSKIQMGDLLAIDIKNAKDDVDDAGLTRILIPQSCVIYLLTKEDIKKYKFGDSDNEEIISVDGDRKLVVVAI
jgi:hypothetical protein